MKKTYVNIACGDSYIDDWFNFDFAPCTSEVKYANLLGRLPLADGSANVVYSSHFIEHIPRDLVLMFLTECLRITQSGGRLRLVLPDWEDLCSTYLALRHEAKHEQANFVMLEMLDQCVRRTSGGELGKYYVRLQTNLAERGSLANFVKMRTGHDCCSVVSSTSVVEQSQLCNNLKKVVGKLEGLYISALVSLLPSAFRQQNVSLAKVGEKHAWMYDYYSLESLLRQVGFIDVQRMSATTSNILDFPFQPLDINHNGLPRKGVESMYIEAVKP